MYRRQVLLEKLKEAAASVLPISLIVLAICFVLVPVDTGLMLSFVLATAMLILGMGLFTLGAEMSMSRIGNYMGAIYVIKSRRAEKEPALPDFGDNEIIELWEAC